MNTETKTAMVMLNVAKQELANIEAKRLATMSSAIALATKQVNEVFAGSMATAQEKVRVAKAAAITAASKCLPCPLKNEEITVKGIRDLLEFCASVVGYEVVSTKHEKTLYKPYFSTIHKVKTDGEIILAGKFVHGGRFSWHPLCVSSYSTTEVMVRRVQTEEDRRIQRIEELRRRDEREVKV